MNELFEFYSRKYKVVWELENEVFYLYFNDDKYRLYVSTDEVSLEKYNRLFKYWGTTTHAHPENLESLKAIIEKYILKKTRY